MMQANRNIPKPKGITKITYVKGIGSTPARVNRRTGELQINMDIWPKLKPEHKRFVLLHEEGHVVLDTSDELAVDEYAFKKYAEEGYPLSESVKAITKLLNNDNPQHNLRAYLQLQRAKAYDYFVNKNRLIDASTIGATPYTDSLKPINMRVQTSLTQRFIGCYSGDSYDNLFGIAIGKAAKARKQAKFEAKLDRKAARTNLINARATSKVNKSEAKLELANQGIAEPGVGDKIAGTLASVVPGVAAIATGGMSAMLQGGASPVSNQDMANAGLSLGQQSMSEAAPIYPRTFGTMGPDVLPVEDQKGKQLKIVAIVVAVIVVAVVIFSVMKNKK